MRVALDTNRYVDLCKGVGETQAVLEEADAILLPFVVLGELGRLRPRPPAGRERTRPAPVPVEGWRARALRRRPDDTPLRGGVPAAPQAGHADSNQRHVARGARAAAQPGAACPGQSTSTACRSSSACSRPARRPRSGSRGSLARSRPPTRRRQTGCGRSPPDRARRPTWCAPPCTVTPSPASGRSRTTHRTGPRLRRSRPSCPSGRRHRGGSSGDPP